MKVTGFALTISKVLTAPAVLPVIMVLSLFFSVIELANLMRLQFYFFHTAYTFYVEIFGLGSDIYLWFLSTFVLALILLSKRGRASIAIAPVALCLTSILLYDLGLRTPAVLLLGFTALLLNSSILYRADSLNLQRHRLAHDMMIVGGIVLIPLQLYAIVVWATHPFFPGYPFDANPKWVVPKLVFQIFSIGYWLSAPALLLILTGWIWGPLASTLARTRFASSSGTIFARGRRKRIPFFAIISAALTIGTFLAYYPALYLPKPVGADSYYYLNLLKYMLGLGSLDLIVKNVVLAGEPHFPYLLFLFLLAENLGLSAVQAVQVAPAFLAVLLVVSTFFVVREITGAMELAFLAALLSAASSVVVVGMFYGIYANWMAMSLILLIVGFTMRYLRIGSRASLLAASLLAILVGYTHPWTWAYFILTLLAFATALLLSRKKGGLGVLTVAAINVMAALVALTLKPSIVLRPDPGSSWGEVFRQFGPTNVPLLLEHLSTTLGTWAASYYSNWIVLSVSLVGVLALRRYGAFKTMMMAWLALAFVGFAVFTPVYEWRILYDMPFTILLVLGLDSILSSMDRFYRGGSGHSLTASNVLLLVVVLSVLESGLRTMAFIAF